ncbi:GAF domain-containing protein [Cellulomonas sp. DKR-3]|uniref:GAF domain-containing protein n=1 Tax=Cellulomonas fulva TaxID=2835530 RepID=A0ABS5TWL6_9CELL|nr:methyl-accepting chemotaxis protein [Cellulomonas fulva]MBT0993548.1 GAF domain-containing protein [Cellulomonas fulva]
MARRRAETVSDTQLLEEAHANAAALTEVVRAVAGVHGIDETLAAALCSVRRHFGWDHASSWRLGADGRLHVAQTDGDLGAEFSRVVAESSFAPGEGINGRALQQRDVMFVGELGAVMQCPPAHEAHRCGVRSAVSLPVSVRGEVTGTIDFFARDERAMSEHRLETLRAVAVLVSEAVERFDDAERQSSAAQDVTAVNRVIRDVTRAASSEAALTSALETIRDSFGWAYGSYWAVDEAAGVLRFEREVGSAGPEFRDVTRSASFARGVGLAGRAWASGDLVFVRDLADVTDCVRAPAARRAGVRSGVCLPVEVDGRIVGTMDFFALEELDLSESRADALRNTAFLVGQVRTRLLDEERLQAVGGQLVASIEEVESNVRAAAATAGEGQRLVESAGEDVAALGESSTQIGQVVNVIQSIAAQTNLLALNATIEAARAGDAGRGFGVVAHEVKELATATATATTQVGEQVRAIQGQVDAVVSALADIRTAVERINDTQTTIGGVLAEQVGVTRSLVA